MNVIDIIHIIDSGEGELVEFKREFDDKSPDRVSRSIAAFANTHGGTLLVGISDDRVQSGTNPDTFTKQRIVGVESPDLIIQRISNLAAKKCVPAVDVHVVKHTLEDKSIIVVSVSKSTNTHFVDEKIYYRVGSTNHAVSDPYQLDNLRNLPNRSAIGAGHVIADIPIFLPPPVPHDFEGRQVELDRMVQFLQGPIPIIAVEGISGIGKTALAIRFANMVVNQGYKAFWEVCNVLTTFETFATHLAAFARTDTNDDLASLLEASNRNTDERLLQIATAISSTRYALFFDDYQNVTDPLFSRFIARIEERAGSSKVILTVRSRNSVLKTSLRAEELHLSSGLDRHACGQFLESWKVGPLTDEIVSQVWTVTGEGHPIGLRLLVARARLVPVLELVTTLPKFSDDVKEKWLAPLLSELPNQEREAVKDFCIFRRAIPIQALCRMYPETKYDARFMELTDRFIIDPVRPNASQIHPMVRDYCESLISDVCDKHLWAAACYLDEVGEIDDYDALPESTKEALLAAWEHFIEAGAHDEANQVIRALRSTLLFRGEPDQLMLLLDRTQPTTDEAKDWSSIDRARILDMWEDTESAIGLLQPLTQSDNDRVAREAILVLSTVLLDRKMAQEASDLLNANWLLFYRNTSTVGRTRFLSRFVEAQLVLGDHGQALRWASEVTQVCQERDDKIGGGIALRQMASAMHASGQSELSLQLCKTSIDVLREVGRPREVAISLQKLGQLAYDFGDHETSRLSVEEALRTFTALGDRKNTQACKSQLSTIV